MPIQAVKRIYSKSYHTSVDVEWLDGAESDRIPALEIITRGWTDDQSGAPGRAVLELKQVEELILVLEGFRTKLTPKKRKKKP